MNKKAVIFKKEIYENYIKDKYKLLAVFEDCPENCKK